MLKKRRPGYWEEKKSTVFTAGPTFMALGWSLDVSSRCNMWPKNRQQESRWAERQKTLIGRCA